MRVLITGGSGFVGSHLADRLLARNDEVLVIDNFSTGRRDNLKPHRNLQMVEQTIADTAAMERIFTEFKPDVVVHAAASYKDPDNWVEDCKTNVLGTINVLNAAKKADCKRIVYFQTALCYGLNPKEQPVSLDHHFDARGSSYAISKTAAEHYVELSGLSFVSFRLANAYGPRNISGPLPTFYHRLTSGKACFVMDTRRDFVFIKDLVDCVERAVDGQGQGYYHISSGSDYSIKELFDATLAALNLKLDKEVEVRPRHPDDAFTILLDPSRTNKDFSWKTSTPLVNGVKAAIDYYKEYGIEQTFTHLRSEETETA
ncbi:nucleotide sugar epimerase [Legionella taurinensis]|uniref:NAD-dependent epimerase/dehydratase family protein n=1 Tax=Legionella taurinensis TaxID=70611 RepID=A0A3A5L4S9_9GAMM|nr:NAD-dependent epimerase/dehydratase family protein [Legionella taurinensis]MDX1837988.1 NAD-dependent epimerase/dehydratase family protein [Legionella taurinensis]PUT39424.1 nucleotide sugar epimerase [Legionella taurinensis]PUT41733.1 nucleotide sugar epimerase [Legionella taurinensis]PUT44567.1 nucleotide sugar epimerase [Legionella taurinensis]PUT46811.1 nucleotide sugar epimerase [Legionella taurinensis]